MRGWSLRSPGAREAVHITLLSLLANVLFLVCSALLTKRFDAEEKMFALLSLADALGGAIVLARFALSRRGAESAATLALGALCVALGSAVVGLSIYSLYHRRGPTYAFVRTSQQEQEIEQLSKKIYASVPAGLVGGAVGATQVFFGGALPSASLELEGVLTLFAASMALGAWTGGTVDLVTRSAVWWLEQAVTLVLAAALVAFGAAASALEIRRRRAAVLVDPKAATPDVVTTPFAHLAFRVCDFNLRSPGPAEAYKVCLASLVASAFFFLTGALCSALSGAASEAAFAAETLLDLTSTAVVLARWRIADAAVTPEAEALEQLASVAVNCAALLVALCVGGLALRSLSTHTEPRYGGLYLSSAEESSMALNMILSVPSAIVGGAIGSMQLIVGGAVGSPSLQKDGAISCFSALTALASWLGATADVLSGGRVWFLDAAITLALCAVFAVVGVVGLCVDARSGCCGRGGAAGERTPLKT